MAKDHDSPYDKALEAYNNMWQVVRAAERVSDKQLSNTSRDEAKKELSSWIERVRQRLTEIEHQSQKGK